MPKVSKELKNKRFIFCDLTYAYARGGGITTYINAKSQYYAKHQIGHVIITPRTDDVQQTKVEKHGLQTIYRVPARKIMIDSLPYYFFRTYSDISSILLKEKPNLLEIGDSFTTFFYGRRLHSLVQRFQGKIDVFVHERLDNFYQQVFQTHRGNWFMQQTKTILAQMITKLLLGRFLGCADAVIANSLFSAQEAKRNTIKHVYTLALGIDTERYYRGQRDEKLQAKLSQNGQKKILLHIGRLEQDKKIDLLVEFAKKLDQDKYVLVVIGDGKYKETLAALPSVIATGYLKQPEILPYLLVADLGILINNIEPFGLVGLEMMASSVPLLAPNAGGLSSFITKDFAWLLPYDPKAYLKALSEWSELTARQQLELRRKARLESEKYSIDKMGERLVALYHKILQGDQKWP